ncbi:hypothetical protein HanRHA438_Chr07g0297351 [Helianthus annuus]|nr:hypothetical protein HanIR_Chr07g0309331 [Helianthus annuus]KAJ0907307.1 hypothetical protein HanRHA438_Chr07g0297351 [Helianthus annuus]
MPLLRDEPLAPRLLFKTMRYTKEQLVFYMHSSRRLMIWSNSIDIKVHTW